MTPPRLSSGYRLSKRKMKNPAHPGRIARSACLEPLGLSVTAGAKVLGVTRQTLTKVISGRSGISPEMAISLSKAFGGTAETWSPTTWPRPAAAKTKSKCDVRKSRG